MAEKNEQERLCFYREGENGMHIEIVGSSDTLMSMVHSAVMSHIELRKLLIPVFMEILKDDDFMKILMDDMLSSIKGKKDDQEDIIDTE